MCKPLYMRDNLKWEKRKKAVDKLSKLNQKKLALVVRKAPDGGIRNTAFQKLTDQSALTKVAKNASDKYIRRDAVKKLTDQSVLAKFAKHGSCWEVRKAAVEKLTDQSVLAKVVKNDSDCTVRQAAVEKLTDQSVLAEVAKKDSERFVRKAAVEKLTDQSALAEVAKNDPYDSVRKAAVEKLTDQSALAEVAKNDSDKDIRKAAVEKLTDQSVLAEIAKNDSDWEVRKTAFEELGDHQSALTEAVINSGQYNAVRELAEILINSSAKDNSSAKSLMQKLDSICKEHPDYFSKLSEVELRCILLWLYFGYCPSQGLMSYPAITNALVRTYRSGVHKQLIGTCSSHITVKYEHIDDTGYSCGQSAHADGYKSTEYLSSLL